MTTPGCDYSFSRPAPKALKAAGLHFAARYVSALGSAKNITKAEAAALAAEGLWIVTVFEGTASRMLSGHAAGAADAHAARSLAFTAGMPSSRPIYFACDFDAQPGQIPAILDYLAGAAGVLGRVRTGIYGGHAAVKAALDSKACAWAWQTLAWSADPDNKTRTLWDARAHLRQTGINGKVAGADVDFDEAHQADYGQWQPGKLPPAPNPKAEAMQLVTSLTLKEIAEIPAGKTATLVWEPASGTTAPQLTSGGTLNGVTETAVYLSSLNVRLAAGPAAVRLELVAVKTDGTAEPPLGMDYQLNGGWTQFTRPFSGQAHWAYRIDVVNYAAQPVTVGKGTWDLYR